MTKAILFDFMGVLLFKRKDYIPDKLVDEIDEIIGKVTNDIEFMESVKKIYNISEEQFGNILIKIVNKYEKYYPVWELLPSLKKKYKIAIINNGTSLTLPLLKSRHKVDEYFDLFISSAEVGVRKPTKEIYFLTAEKLGVKPAECLFMDDSRENTDGAKSIGMQTIWWENEEKGFIKLKKFLELKH